MRVIVSLVAAAVCGVAVLAASGQAAPAYLGWTAEQADRIGKAMRVNGRVGGAFDLRVVHTEHSFNYKLRATWLTPDVIRATARILQLSDRLTNDETEALVREASAAGDVVMMIEIDPREGSGVIPNDWSAFFGPAGSDDHLVRGTNRPDLEKSKVLRGVYRRDYNYEVFWVVFPLKTSSGTSLFPNGVSQAELRVRITTKEGRVSFPIPQNLSRD